MAKQKDRIGKTVNFSFSDPYEMKMLEYVEQQGAFSKYVKRLIQRDMEGGFSEPTPVKRATKKIDSSAIPEIDIDDSDLPL